MAVAAEESRVRVLFQKVDVLESLAERVEPADREQLLDVAHWMLDIAEPVRPVVAAALLDLSDRTVRAWAKEGVLRPARADSPRLLLDPARLHEVIALVRDLRAAGRTKGLLDAIWYRLSDRALIDSEDFQESVAQMLRGEGDVVYERDEDD